MPKMLARNFPYSEKKAKWSAVNNICWDGNDLKNILGVQNEFCWILRKYNCPFECVESILAYANEICFGKIVYVANVCCICWKLVECRKHSHYICIYMMRLTWMCVSECCWKLLLDLLTKSPICSFNLLKLSTTFLFMNFLLFIYPALVISSLWLT